MEKVTKLTVWHPWVPSCLCSDTRADFDLQLGFNSRKYFATGYDVILMKCACLPGLWKEMYRVNRVALSNLAHKHIKVKMAGFLNEETRGFFFDDRTDHLPLIYNIFFCKSISNVFTSENGAYVVRRVGMTWWVVVTYLLDFVILVAILFNCAVIGEPSWSIAFVGLTHFFWVAKMADQTSGYAIVCCTYSGNVRSCTDVSKWP
jgi:hypothetical protein